MRRDCSVETSNPNDGRPKAKARSGNKNTIESAKECKYKYVGHMKRKRAHEASGEEEEEEEIAKKKCNQESEAPR